FLLLSLPSFARVVRLDVTAREDAPFGYERIKGSVTFALDPANAHNRIIADLDKADRLEFSADVVILRPKCGGNGTLFIDVPNRGNVGALASPANDDFLFRNGYTVAAVGWQFDVVDKPEQLKFRPPVARGVRGRVRSEFTVDAAVAEYPLAHFITASWGNERVDAIGGTEYAAVDLKDAVLTERNTLDATRRVIPRKKWRFVNDRTITLDGKFVPNTIYEIVFTAADPVVAGTGLAAVRDFVAWAKHDPSSPIPVERAYGIGFSQTGRFLRHFVYDGFNADEAGRQVFDAMLVYVAGAGRGSFNQRFAQPSRPVDPFPFTDLPTTDPFTGRTAGLLDRAVAEQVVPKIFYLNTSYEYWSRGGSLIHTTPDGRADVAPAPTSRIYALAGFSHFAGPFPPQKTAGGRNLQNPLEYWLTVHPLIEAIDAWVKKGTEPPPSLYPRITDGTLVTPAKLALQTINGADFPTWTYQPRTSDEKHAYATLVMQVGADGNELAGLRTPFLTVPIATHTAWNLRDPATGFPTDRTPFSGSLIPFAKLPYTNRDEYLGRFTAATLQLIGERYLTAGDLQYVLPLAVQLWDWAAARPGRQ
ncbi:MAG: hypothetical protein QOH21_3748, partial [Acidobacteriota bacterium]|nr:hypothetical protein [Acidobacteriota bacterium]